MSFKFSIDINRIARAFIFLMLKPKPISSLYFLRQIHKVSLDKLNMIKKAGCLFLSPSNNCQNCVYYFIFAKLAKVVLAIYLVFNVLVTTNAKTCENIFVAKLLNKPLYKG